MLHRSGRHGDFALGYGVSVKRPLTPVLIRGLLARGAGTPSGAPILTIHAKVPEGASGGLVIDSAGSLVGMIMGYYADEPNCR
jgi:hypothetical protein